MMLKVPGDVDAKLQKKWEGTTPHGHWGRGVLALGPRPKNASERQFP